MAQRTYWLTRFVILRLLGAVYAIAFLVAINQRLNQSLNYVVRLEPR